MWADHHDGRPEFGADLAGPALVLPGEEHGHPVDLEPIIDRDDEVPERYWAPEIAGLGRRALALLVDQLLLAAVLGIFFLGALTALQNNGLTTGLLLTADGLQASALPFALLAALLSLGYSGFFHGSTGRTPGKALVGIEVRTGNGGAMTWDRAILRWLGAALGLGCAGAGIFWALFEPRRRSWADLISGTVVARPQRESAPGFSRR
ncbi:MAG: RDD family protein [Candidatus Methylomirabilia bacterium]